MLNEKDYRITKEQAKRFALFLRKDIIAMKQAEEKEKTQEASKEGESDDVA